MKHPKKTREITADILFIGSEFFQGLGRCLEHGSISYPLIAANKASKLFRHGKGSHEMMPGQLPNHLLFQPLSGLVILAGGAMTITARSEDRMVAAAFITLVNHSTEAYCAAFDDGINDFSMFNRHGITEVLDIFRPEGAENFTYLAHGQILS